jgi:hypothetical protein
MARWDETRQGLEQKRQRYEWAAKGNRILPPFYEDELFEDFNRELEEGDPTFNPALQALTRLTEPSVSLIILDPVRGAAIDQRATPGLLEALALLRQAVTLSDRRVVHHLLRQPAPPGWANSPLLRYHRLIILDARSRARVPGSSYVLALDSKRGVLVESQDSENASIEE